MNQYNQISAQLLEITTFLSFIKGLIRHFTANENEEIIDKIFQSLINDGRISTTLITNTSFLRLLHNSNNFYKKSEKHFISALINIIKFFFTNLFKFCINKFN